MLIVAWCVQWSHTPQYFIFKMKFNVTTEHSMEHNEFIPYIPSHTKAYAEFLLKHKKHVSNIKT